MSVQSGLSLLPTFREPNLRPVISKDAFLAGHKKRRFRFLNPEASFFIWKLHTN
jgi:hypothetical protein|tara:strand:+ start:807 stop:968 length:162 start_codon:yes stop_codon:yes gene_type:complete